MSVWVVCCLDAQALLMEVVPRGRPVEVTQPAQT